MFLKRWQVPKGIEHEAAQSAEFDYTDYWSGYDVSQRTLFVQPEDCPMLTKFTLKADLTEKTTKNISHQLLAH